MRKSKFKPDPKKRDPRRSSVQKGASDSHWGWTSKHGRGSLAPSEAEDSELSSDVSARTSISESTEADLLSTKASASKPEVRFAEKVEEKEIESRDELKAIEQLPEPEIIPETPPTPTPAVVTPPPPPPPVAPPPRTQPPPPPSLSTVVTAPPPPTTQKVKYVAAVPVKLPKILPGTSTSKTPSHPPKPTPPKPAPVAPRPQPPPKVTPEVPKPVPKPSAPKRPPAPTPPPPPEEPKKESFEETPPDSEDDMPKRDLREHHRSPKKRQSLLKPRPVAEVTSMSDFDDDFVGSIEGEESSSGRKSTRLSIFDQAFKAPDDELLYTLTQKEEHVYRRSVGEMRWEEEESRSQTQQEDFDETDTSESTAAALLWERIGPPSKALQVPVISVNEHPVSLSHLEPEETPKKLSSATLSEHEISIAYQSVFQGPEDENDSDSDSDPVQTIFDLIDETNQGRVKERASVDTDAKRTNVRAKLWRRRLVVVVLLNFVMRYRRKFVTINELIMPVILLVLIGGMVMNSDLNRQALEERLASRNTNETEDPFEQIGADKMFLAFCSNLEYCGSKIDRHYYIVYSPKNNFTNDLMHRVLEYLKFDTPTSPDEELPEHERNAGLHSQLIGVANAVEVEKACQDHWKSIDDPETTADYAKYLRYAVGIIFSFDGGLLSKSKMENISMDMDLPHTLTYTLRTHYTEIANTVEGFPFREKNSSIHQSISPYIHTGIIGMQMAIDMAFAKKIIEKSDELGDTEMKIGEKNPIYVSRDSFFRRFLDEPVLQQFEYPTYKGPDLKIRGWISITMAILLSYVTCDVCVAQIIVHEQRLGSIELLKIHGMTTSMRWVAYMIITGILRGVTTLAMALIIHYLLIADAVAKHSSSMLLWGFLWMHGCAATCFTYLITIGITKPELAGLVVVCVSFLTLLCPMSLYELGYLSKNLNMLLCYLFPQWNLANGLHYYLQYTIYDEGLDWYDFPVMIDYNHNRIIALPFACSIFFYSTMTYLMLTIYLDHILPREFSPKERKLFCCPSFWRKPPSETPPTRPIIRRDKPSVYQPGPREAKYGPRFRDVTLTTGNNVTVLDNISLDIYEGEVTCIVGQTGSGKSDFLNVIAGVSNPSQGFVDVKGMKVHEYYDFTNRYVSLCPQKQLLVDTLSVEDHVRLCCMLHGASYGKAKTQAAFLLQMFGLTSMRRHNYKGLTVSDTKKLLIAMALSKSPSILLLDNPIDQLDAEGSFQFWKLLQELKTERSIIVTCTMLEEAELYGDRIAILSKGKLVCYGTPSYIKLAYGIGGVMSLRKAEHVNEEPDIPGISEIMNQELRGAKTTLLETTGISLHNDTIQFILPYGKFYGSLIEKLEANMAQLRISKIYMSQPSLWALFYQMAKHPGIEQVIARTEARILKGLKGDDDNINFEAVTHPNIPTLGGKPNRSLLNIGSILVMKKIWYYRQKHACFLIAYMAQIILVLQLVFFSRMFLFHEPERLAKSIDTRLYSNNYILVRSADNEHTREGWEEAFRHVIMDEEENIEIESLGYQDSIESFLAAGKSHSLTHYRKQMNVAFTRDESGHIGYYASNSIHAAPIASHIMMQAFLYMISPNRTFPHSTEVISHPLLPYPNFPAGSTQSNSATILGVFLSVILALLSAPALRSILTEKLARFKMIQRMAGVSSVIYWICHGIGDLMLYILLTGMCLVLMFFSDEIGWNQLDGDNERLTLSYIFFGWLCWAGIPYTYFISQLIKPEVAGYGYYLMFHFGFGVIPKIIIYQMYRLRKTGFILLLRYLLYIFPPYTLTSACVHYFHVIGSEKWCKHVDQYKCQMYENATILLDEYNSLDKMPGAALNYLYDQLAYNDTFRTCCKQYCELAGTCLKEHDFFPTTAESVIPGLRQDMTALVVNGFMYWILVVLIEKQMIQGLFFFITTKLCGNLEKTVAERDLKTSDEPEDVKDEHQKVDYMVEIEGAVDSEVYLVQDVTKFYLYTKGLDHVYFSVPVNTITGILGLPKSGKTTLLDILTTQVIPSAGYIYKDNDLLDSKSRKQLMLKVGYCPQTSFLLPYLTGGQMMTIMGRLRGLNAQECEQHAHWWLEEFGLKDAAKKKCNAYRKGEERRLCCAMALIGDSKMIIYDEPTQFMDSLEKYLFWNIVSRLPAMDRTILFASADADEVQHQSAKVLLLDSGTLVAVGQLKEIFKNNNQGMFLAIRYGVQHYRRYTDFQKKAKIDKLRDHIFQYLSPCSLLDEQENLLIYHLKDQNMKLSRVYTVMEGAKVRFSSLLEHFQVFEPSLDDIIVLFHKARNKRQEKLSKVAADEYGTETGESNKTETAAT